MQLQFFQQTISHIYIISFYLFQAPFLHLTRRHKLKFFYMFVLLVDVLFIIFFKFFLAKSVGYEHLWSHLSPLVCWDLIFDFIKVTYLL